MSPTPSTALVRIRTTEAAERAEGVTGAPAGTATAVAAVVGAVTGDGVGERLVTVLLTLAVPEVADPEDAAALVADAAATTALEVRHAVGVEGHLPAPGATVVRPGRRQPWQVVAVSERPIGWNGR